MLPTNVMTFMKKMVASEEAATSSAQNIPEAGSGTFGKLKQTLSSSLLTAQDRVNKMSPKSSSTPLENESTYSDNQQQQSIESVVANQSNTGSNNLNTVSAVSSTSSTATATTNKQQNEPAGRRAGACRVCLKSFKPNDFHKICFECKQRVCEDCASYSKLEENEDANMWRCSVCRRKMASRVCMPHDSTDSLLDVPVLEALQRRHSDAKLGSTQTLAPANGAVLAPPRSPELRRHSDVSPASLKELEKLKGCKTPGGDELDWQRGGGRSMAPSRSNSPPRHEDISAGPPLSRKTVRRASNIGRQHSYDDEPLSGSISGTLGLTVGDTGFGVPSMPRRKSAYDVFATGTLQPGATTNIPQRSPADGVIIIAPQISVAPSSRRSSIRIPHEDMQTDENRNEERGSPALTVDEDRPIRRRGSQLPDLAALQSRGAIPSNLPPSIPQPLPTFTGPNLEDLEAPRRQTSMDGEAIKIVIHDVDSGPICSSKRRIVLRRDPTDNAHRTRGFGMRVVGGKTGADGKLFAYIVWTVPGGAAEKNGLQQGDKILEWNGMSLIDRSFEEVCSVMDRTGDVVELLVEHATDFRMCDLFDENLPPGSSGGSDGGSRRPGDDPVSLSLMPESETTVDKSPASPTRRKLPKTPEQIAREKQVSGRVQIQVWYNAERNELVVSLMAADDLALRSETYGHGNLPEAYAKVRILPKFADGLVQQTEVSTPTQNPIWNATLTFPNVTAEILMDHYIDIQLWDLVPHTESIFLGECNIELQQAFIGDRAIWCRLEDPKGLRGISWSKSFNVSPRGSLATSCQIDVTRLLRRDNNTQRSISDDIDSIGDSTCLLHPDHAYIAGSRRGSSQSETMELEVYQLNKDFSRSLPSSRRSSFQGAENQAESDLPATPPTTYMVGRRRSSLARKDSEEVLKSLKAVRGELGRAMSLGTEQPIAPTNIRMGSRRHSRAVLPSNPVSRRNSIFDVTTQQNFQFCIDNNTISALPNDEHKRQHWLGNSSYLPPQTVKQALTTLKHTTSATNVSHNAANDWRQHLATAKQQHYHRSSQNIEHRESTRKGSMFNLTSTSIANTVSFRKGSTFALNANVNDGKSHKYASSHFQEKSNMYTDLIATTGVITSIHNINRQSSISLTPPVMKRKEHMTDLDSNTTDTIILRKQSIDANQYNSSKASNNFNNFLDNKCISITKATTTTTSSSSSSIKTGIYTDYGLKLGPGQIHPKNYRLITARHGELKMGFIKIKGTVEIEILCARNIAAVDCETPPDTYVKCYIKDGEHLRHKKKTRVVRRAVEPIYKQTIKYQSSDVFGRNIVIMLWQRCVGFEHNQGLGGTEINLDKVEMAQHIGGWYPLFPMHSYGGFDSENSS